jgi:hypothetical protein
VTRALLSLAAAALALAGLTALTACGGGGGSPEPAEPDPTHLPPAVDFSATITPESGAVVVTYTLRNAGKSGIVVYNGVTADGGFGAPDPNAVYVTGAANNTAQVAKRVFDAPAGVDLDARAVIRGEIVPPGGQTGETVRVPLPLVASHPYGPEQAGNLPEPVRRVVFCLGVARQSDYPERLRTGMPAPGASPAASPGKYGYFPHPSPQHLLCSRPYDLP